jgi:glycogen debranching enzyme
MSSNRSPGPVRPRLRTPARPDLEVLYDAALHNLLDINTVPIDTPEGTVRCVRAGSGYPDPWTRDASINVWGAASVVAPDEARSTLFAVCERAGDGRRTVAQDDQWWDQIVWVLGAWQHYLATGDRAFLAEAYGIGRASMEILHRARFRPRYGLYAGPAFMQDGISGYPLPVATAAEETSFVLDYPAAHEIMCLSTNAVYAGAYRDLAAMAAELGEDPDPYTTRAAGLRGAIDERLWLDDAGRYGYFVHGSGALAGTVDRHEEAAGVAFAVLAGVADRPRADRILSATHRRPRGVVNVWPHFPERYGDQRPGRHNAICWPMVMGLFGLAGAVAGRADVAAECLEDIVRLASGSGNRFEELYDAVTGTVSGGFQCGRDWDSVADQTWSATAYLRLVHSGLFGLDARVDGLHLRDAVPAGYGELRIEGYRYRSATLDLTVTGDGALATVSVDGVELPPGAPVLGPDAEGAHRAVVGRSSAPA